MSEEELDKARLGLDVVDDLEAGELVGVPILPCTHRGGRERNNSQKQQQQQHRGGGGQISTQLEIKVYFSSCYATCHQKFEFLLSNQNMRTN